MEAFKFKVGDTVRKHGGYQFPGVVVAAYMTLKNEPRYVVECTAFACQGMQHIFNGVQLVRTYNGAFQGELEL